MAYNRVQAARLLAAAELPVFEASLGDALAALTASRLQVLIRRARTMRDKAQDLHRRQRVATRARTGSKAGTSGMANERTAKKAQALDEALKRFEQRLAQLEAAAARAAAATRKAAERLAATSSPRGGVAAKPAAAGRKTAAKTAAKAAPAKTPATASPVRSAKAPAKRPKASGSPLPAASPGAHAVGARQQRKFTGSQAIQAHVGARGRRVQAKRDKR